MADTSLFQEVGGNLLQKVFSGLIWFGLAFIFIGVIGFLMYWFIFYRRRFDIDVKIKSDRADDKENIIFDKAAILTERKSGVKYFKLWDLKKELPIPRYNVLQRSNKGDFLELYRKGENEIYFCNPSKISKTKVMKEDGNLYGIAEQESIRMDIDLDYWQAKRKKDNKSMFDNESVLMKLLPYLPAAMISVIMIFVLYILLDHLPGILSQLQELYKLQANVCKAEVVTG